MKSFSIYLAADQLTGPVRTNSKMNESLQAYLNLLQGMRLFPLASVCESSETLAMDDVQSDTVSEGGRPGVTFDSSAIQDHDVDNRMPPQVSPYHGATNKLRMLLMSLARGVLRLDSARAGWFVR